MKASRRLCITATLFCLGAGSAAWAQAGGAPPPGAPAPAAAPAPGGPPAPGPSKPSRFKVAAEEDAMSDHIWLAPTAITPAKGSLSVHVYQLFGVGISYGITDRVQVSLGAAYTPVDRDFRAAALLVKAQVWGMGPLTVAAQGGAGISPADDGSILAELGVAATVCADGKCRVQASGFAGVFHNWDQSLDDENDLAFLGSGAIALGLGKRLKLMGEVGAALSDDAVESKEVYAWYGIRITGQMLGVDLGFQRPLFSDNEDDLPVGLPWINVTARAK